ncbi:MAG: periplasmic heavy metal sensor [Betaproteobacteria bacterium]|nr:MAG: periplasmic heavy metal sensor [Betaproteobacteria bacterium]
MADSSRRRFFRRITIATLVGGLAAGIGAKAWAHGGPGHGHHARGFMSGPMDPAQMDARIERMVKHLAVEVDATPEQRAKLTAIAKSAATELQPMRAKARDARKRGMELLAAPSVDRAAIERLRSEQIQAADAASKRLSQALADAAEVLTPEQRVKLAQHFQKRQDGRRGGHRQRG